MAESSILWTTDGTGDGGSEYTQAELIRWLRQTFIGDNTDEGVLKNYLNELEVTDDGGADVAINTGGAYVYGFPYWNTASVGKTLSTPTGDVRIDRIVLQADWTAQTVRIAVVEGIEGGAAPAVTQTDGTKWEISLAQVQIGTDGDIDSVTDERVFVHPNIEIEAAMMASVLAHAGDHERAGSDEVDGDHLDIDWDPSNYTPATTPAEAADVDDLAAHLYGIDQAITDGPTKEFFVNAFMADGDYSYFKGAYRAVTLDQSGYDAYMTFLVPNDYNSITDAVIVVIPDTNDNAAWDIDIEVNYAAKDEAYQTHTDSDTASTYDLSAADLKITEIDISGLLGSIAAGDYVGVTIENNAVLNGMWVLGLRFRYS